MIKNRAILFGAGGHARVIRSFIQDTYDEILCFTSDGVNAYLSEKALLDLQDQYLAYDMFLGIGDNTARRRIFEMVSNLGWRLPPVIAPTAYVSPNAQVKSGAFIGAGASVVANAVMKQNTILNTHSSIDHDCIMEAHAQIAPGVHVAGGCQIQAMAFIGCGSTLIPGVRIGEGAQVAAHSLVSRPVKAYTLVAGAPSRVRRTLVVK